MVSFKLNIFSATSYSKKKMFGWNRRFRYLQKKGKDKKCWLSEKKRKIRFSFSSLFFQSLSNLPEYSEDQYCPRCLKEFQVVGGPRKKPPDLSFCNLRALKSVPDRPFYNFGASKSVTQRSCTT